MPNLLCMPTYQYQHALQKDLQYSTEHSIFVIYPTWSKHISINALRRKFYSV